MTVRIGLIGAGRAGMIHGRNFAFQVYDLRMSNGPLAEVSSHDIDTVRWLTGSEITEVYAIAGTHKTLMTILLWTKISF